MNEAEKIKELRNLSGASLLECKKALRRCGGDINLALVELRKRGNEPPDPEPAIID
jgi:translation elongation factor EF-Ts